MNLRANGLTPGLLLLLIVSTYFLPADSARAAHSDAVSLAGITLNAADVSHELGKTFVQESAGLAPYHFKHAKATIYERWLESQDYLNAVPTAEIKNYAGYYVVTSWVMQFKTPKIAQKAWYSVLATGLPLIQAAGIFTVEHVKDIGGLHKGTEVAEVQWSAKDGTRQDAGTTDVIWVKGRSVVGEAEVAGIGGVNTTGAATALADLMSERMEVK